MEKFDVIIVGAGPAGLQCAKVLGESNRKVLLLEKDSRFGDKVCAGGITRKDLAILHPPDSIIEHKVTQTAVHSPKRSNRTQAPEPFVFTVDRRVLGQWQRQQLNGSTVEVRSQSKVTRIEKDFVEVNGNEKLAFDILVGADGVNSLVRRYLNVPLEKRLIGLQYLIPGDFEPRLEIFMHSKYFGPWYAWSFPHKDSIAVGCVADPKLFPVKKLKANFHRWLDEKGFDLSAARYESWPISYDYRGFRFGNVFLAGEAAGLASGFTGEGIYQSLVSGETVARTILDENYQSEEFEAVLRYNRIQNRIMKVLLRAGGPVRSLLQEGVVKALNTPRIQRWVSNSFS